MQIARKCLGALMLATCLLAALVFGGHSVAQAASWWPNPGGNELTVYATGNEKLREDLADVEAYVNLFKVADAVPEDNYQAFTYKYAGRFGSGPVTTPEVGDPYAKEKWQEIAREAALKVEKGESDPPIGSGDFLAPEYNVTMSGLGDGIYLAVIFSHKSYEWEKDESGSATGSTTITGARAEYTFAPQLIALPSKSKDGSESASSDPGPWLKKLTIILKPEVKGRYGSLVINKTVVGPTSDESATFVFHIVDTETGGNKYENYAAITWPAANQTTVMHTTVTHIPAGMEVTVTEQYEGARFYGDGSEAHAVIVADVGSSPTASVSFTNTGNDNETSSGNGIQNNFELTKKEGESASAWDWKWTATPSQE